MLYCLFLADISIDFGVVFIYTCKDSCWSSSQYYLPEYAIVQADPDHELLSKKREKPVAEASGVFTENTCKEKSDLVTE